MILQLLYSILGIQMALSAGIYPGDMPYYSIRDEKAKSDNILSIE